MSAVTYRSVYTVQRRWTQTQEDLDETRRRLGAQDTAGVPTSVRAVAGIFLDSWAGYAGESAAIAAGFVLALSAADYTFRGVDGYVAERLLLLDGRLGPAR